MLLLLFVNLKDNQPIADSPVWHLLAQVYKDMGEVQGNVTDSHQVKSYCLVLLCGEIEHGNVDGTVKSFVSFMFCT